MTFLIENIISNLDHRLKRIRHPQNLYFLSQVEMARSFEATIYVNQYEGNLSSSNADWPDTYGHQKSAGFAYWNPGYLA